MRSNKQYERIKIIITSKIIYQYNQKSKALIYFYFPSERGFQLVQIVKDESFLVR